MNKLLTLLDRLPWLPVVAAALSLGLAPFVPQPHIWEKLLMLVDGSLAKPMDMLDLMMHGAPWLVLFAKAVLSCQSAGR